MPSNTLGAFTCNVCGSPNRGEAEIENRERQTCGTCGSSLRSRSVVLSLTRALFGKDWRLDELPRLKALDGLGISDSETYAGRLGDLFHYTNTFYHRAPLFDLTNPDEREFGRYDFVICSEVLEHVQAPLDRAFDTLARLLKPAGVLIVTVPFSLEGATDEHFPQLHRAALVEIDGRTVLVNRTREGAYQVYDRLVFHGTGGSTLEQRLFSEADLRARLAAAGFATVKIDSSGSHKFGVVYDSPCSLPIVASHQPFALGPEGISELIEPFTTLQKACRESRWLRLGRLLRLGPDLKTLKRP